MSRKQTKKEILPIDERFKKVFNSLTNKTEDVPELDPRWKENVQFVNYLPIPIQINPDNHQPCVKDDASLEEWKERSTFINQDLKWLLCLSHSQFWSQVIFDESLQSCLDSYLKQAPRSFDLLKLPLPDELSTLEQSLYKRVFMVFLRMATHKESKECFFTPEIFGEVLYCNYLFDIPKLMDICALYGGADSVNLPLLRKMIENIFDKQPKYYDDLNETIPSLLTTLDNILSKFRIKDPANNSPQKISDSNSTTNGLGQQEIFDIVLYLSDIGHTINTFAETFPKSCQHFLNHGIVTRFASFFEMIIPFLEDKLKSKELKMVKWHLRRAMTSLVGVCNIVLRTCCIDPLLTSSSNAEETQRCAEDYSQVLMSILSEKRFISWYDTQFSIENDLITIQSCPGSTLDSTRVQYITDAIHSAHAAYPNKLRQKKTKQASTDGKPVNDVNGFLEEPGTSRDKTEGEQREPNAKEEQAASFRRDDVDPVQVESMVTNVRDLLPDLGEGFVMKCLQEYNYDIETVINSLLENKLCDSLNNLDRTMTKAQAIDTNNEPQTIISTRHSVFDKDEFDVFTKGTSIDLSRIHKGKKRDETNLESLLAEKSHVTESVKERFSRYDVYGQLNKPDDFDEYDDEYDDTYDSLDVGAQDDDSADELTTRRPFSVPRILRKPPAEQSSESDHETAEDEQDPNDEKSSEPQTKWRTADKRPGHKGYYTEGYANRGRGQSRGTTEPSVGTKGPKGPKGRGSKAKVPPDPATLKKRNVNERHKSQRANHNRKAGAEWKRNKGMGALPK